MSEYEGCYLIVDGDTTFWLVEDGERWALSSQYEMLTFGLRPVYVVEGGVLEAIPVKGMRQGTAVRQDTDKRKRADERKEEEKEA